jgi:hypothetical protein
MVTRAGQVKVLGLKGKGHLGVGADADVASYKIKRALKENCNCQFGYFLCFIPIIIDSRAYGINNLLKSLDFSGKPFWVVEEVIHAQT